MCLNCEVAMPINSRVGRAIEKWNRRVGNDSCKDKNEENS